MKKKATILWKTKIVTKKISGVIVCSSIDHRFMLSYPIFNRIKP